MKTATTARTTTKKQKKENVNFGRREMNVVVVVVVRAHLLKGKLIISKKRLKDLIKYKSRINRNMTSLEKI